MSRNTSTARRARKLALVATAATAAAVAASVVPVAASASTSSTVGSVLDAAHPWRHGIVPTVEGAKNYALGLPIGLPIDTNLSYGGGTNGVGVTTGAPKV